MNCLSKPSRALKSALVAADCAEAVKERIENKSKDWIIFKNTLTTAAGNWNLTPFLFLDATPSLGCTLFY